MEPLVIKYVPLNLRYLYLYHPIKNITIKIDDVIHGNEIGMYDQSHGGNGELKKMKHGNYHIFTNRNHCLYQKNDS